MTLVRLAGNDVVLHSPCRPSDGLLREIVALGRVTDIIAPNWLHDLYLREYRVLFPNARFWGPRLLRWQHKSIVDSFLDGPVQAPWANELAYLSLSGLLSFDESVFYHAASRTLIVADMLINVGAEVQTPPITRLVYRFFGLRGQLKVFPSLRWFGFSSRASMRRVANQIFEWRPQRLVVAHGTPVAENAEIQLREALGWLCR